MALRLCNGDASSQRAMPCYRAWICCWMAGLFPLALLIQVGSILDLSPLESQLWLPLHIRTAWPALTKVIAKKTLDNCAQKIGDMPSAPPPPIMRSESNYAPLQTGHTPRTRERHKLYRSDHLRILWSGCRWQ